MAISTLPLALPRCLVEVLRSVLCFVIYKHWRTVNFILFRASQGLTLSHLFCSWAFTTVQRLDSILMFTSGNLLRKGAHKHQILINHFQGTNPVTYNTKGWLKACRENPVSRTATGFLQDSHK